MTGFAKYALSSSKTLALVVFLINVSGLAKYFFKWGDPATSPGYEIVPTHFFIWWNSLTLVTVLMLFFHARKINIYFGLGYAYLLITSAICLFASNSFYVEGSARSFILNGLVFILISTNAGFVRIEHLNRCFEILVPLVLCFLLFQIVNVHWFDNFPSHSHPDFLVRYGSIYDDSLVFAVIGPMFSGYYIKKFQTIFSRYFICIVSLGVSVLTGSLTGAAIMSAYILWVTRDDAKLLILYCITLLIGIVIGFNILMGVIMFKQESISGHLAGWSDLMEITTLAFLGLWPTGAYPEQGYISMLLNFGFPITLGLAGLFAYLFSICVSLLKNPCLNFELKKFVGATEGLLISVVAANFNFPVVIYPPIYFMLALFGGIVFFHRKRLLRNNDTLQVNTETSP